MTTSSHCNTGRACLPLPITTRENTPLAIHVVQKITIIRAQKIGKFAVWNLILYTGAIWRRREKFEYGCTTTYHPYKKPKHFFRIAQLNRLSVRTNVRPTVRFWYHRYELESFSWHPHKWSKLYAQTLHPFSQILKIFPRIGTPIVAPPSDNFENCSIDWKGLFFCKKNTQNRI